MSRGGRDPTQNVQGALCSWPMVATETPSVQTQGAHEVWLFPLTGALVPRHSCNSTPILSLCREAATTIHTHSN